MDETKGHACFENAFRVGVHGPIHSASVPRQRMQSMDVLKFVAIFFVLWGHAEQYLLSGDYSDRMVYRHIYSFHMPLFMMISGFFFAMTVKPKVMENIIGKARQLLLPAVCWSVIFIVIAIVFTRQNLSFDSIRYGMMQSLWFLKSAFACSMLGRSIPVFPAQAFRSSLCCHSFAESAACRDSGNKSSVYVSRISCRRSHIYLP